MAAPSEHHQRRVRGTRGGIVALLEFLAEHWERVEADFLSEYGIDLLDLGTDRLSWGRLARLVGQLPRESRTMQEVGGDELRWGDSEHMLASLIELVAVLDWRYQRVHFKGEPPAPKPLRRPGMPDPTVRIGGKRAYSPAEMDAIWARIRAKGVS